MAHLKELPFHTLEGEYTPTPPTTIFWRSSEEPILRLLDHLNRTTTSDHNTSMARDLGIFALSELGRNNDYGLSQFALIDLPVNYPKGAEPSFRMGKLHAPIVTSRIPLTIFLNTLADNVKAFHDAHRQDADHEDRIMNNWSLRAIQDFTKDAQGKTIELDLQADVLFSDNKRFVIKEIRIIEDPKPQKPKWEIQSQEVIEVELEKNGSRDRKIAARAKGKKRHDSVHLKRALKASASDHPSKNQLFDDALLAVRRGQNRKKPFVQKATRKLAKRDPQRRQEWEDVAIINTKAQVKLKQDLVKHLLPKDKRYFSETDPIMEGFFLYNGQALKNITHDLTGANSDTLKIWYARGPLRQDSYHRPIAVLVPFINEKTFNGNGLRYYQLRDQYQRYREGARREVTREYYPSYFVDEKTYMKHLKVPFAQVTDQDGNVLLTIEYTPDTISDNAFPEIRVSEDEEEKGIARPKGDLHLNWKGKKNMTKDDVEKIVLAAFSEKPAKKRSRKPHHLFP